MATTQAQGSDIGVIGLAVMGENLILNMERNGFQVSVYNRTTEKVDAFMGGRGAGKNLVGAHSLEELVESLASPRKVMLMVQAGKAVDAVIAQLLPLLSKGDIIIDGGNSNYADSARRMQEAAASGVHFIGAGVSGGEEGALWGPSIMPGGDEKAWPSVGPIFQAISAKAGTNADEACTAWIGKGGAGHFVKMVHNGIEYGDMQLISESYALMSAQGKDNATQAEIFTSWNSGELESYLVEITAQILEKKDEESGAYVLDLILDSAGQKGTGKWTAIDSLNFGIPLTLISEAVFARFLSSLVDQRHKAAEVLGSAMESGLQAGGELSPSVDELAGALYLSRIISYAQGFALITRASTEYDWSIDSASLAKIWRGGCIIRSAFLNDIAQAFQDDGQLTNLLMAPFFAQQVKKHHSALRKTVAYCAMAGIAAPALSSALAYLDGYSSKRSSANMIQAQRDFFGAHTYERVDRSRGEMFHTNWTGSGGSTHSSAYNA